MKSFNQNIKTGSTLSSSKIINFTCNLIHRLQQNHFNLKKKQQHMANANLPGPTLLLLLALPFKTVVGRVVCL